MSEIKEILKKGWDEPSNQTQKDACIKAIDVLLNDKNTNCVEFLIELRDLILEHSDEECIFCKGTPEYVCPIHN